MERRMLEARLVNLRALRSRRRQRRGFTLVELAIVVVIVGVLAVVAVVGYRRYVQHAKISEAQTVISAIRIAQEDTRAERGSYVNVGASTYCPAGAGVGTHKFGWTPTCNGGVASWEALPVHVDGPVLFGYATVSSTPAAPNWAEPPETSWVTWNSPSSNTPWYVVMAKCDLDGDPTNHTMLVGSSLSNAIFSHNEGL